MIHDGTQHRPAVKVKRNGIVYKQATQNEIQERSDSYITRIGRQVGSRHHPQDWGVCGRAVEVSRHSPRD